MPVVTRSRAIDSEYTAIGSSFGGLVYITVGHGALLGNISNIKLSGAYETISYWHGSMSTSQWAEHRAAMQALGAALPPWGELVGHKFIFSLPSEVLLTVTDPEALMNYWDDVADYEDDLLGYHSTDNWRTSVGRAERFVVDVQISNGWMHSGYPIMAYKSVASSQVDLAHLETDKGEWGPYHELGHNHQWNGFVTTDATEVSCNWFSVYIVEKKNQFPLSGTDSNSLCADISRQEMKSPDFSGLGPWKHLNFYMTIKVAFGWGVFNSVMSEYVTGDGTDYGDYSSAERIDYLIIKLSLATNFSLTGWADAWHYPITDIAREATARLTTWDYLTALDDMDELLMPSRECYTPLEAKRTEVRYNDSHLPEILLYNSKYRGKQNTTISGYTCQRWDSQAPNTHTNSPADEPCEGLYENNYCRNPDNEPQPWCYTVDGPRWEFCAIPECPDPNARAPPPTPSPTAIGAVSTDKASYTTGEQVDVSFARPAGATATDWLSVTDRGQVPPSIVWQYACGGTAACGEAVADGAVSFPADGLDAGDYDVTYLNNDGYEILAGPVGFSVDHPNGTPVCSAALSPPSTNTHIVPIEQSYLSIVAFSSCYKPSYQISDLLWKHVRTALGPELWLWLGDNMYADGNNMEDKRIAYNAARDDVRYAAYGPIASPKIPVMATWVGLMLCNVL
jgi:hypothetical protein